MRLPFPKMPSPFVLGLAGISVASGLFAFTTRSTYRRIAQFSAGGAGIGACLTFYNDGYHSAECHHDVAKPAVLGRPLVTVRRQFHTMKDKIYSHITDRYNELGQIALGEEHLTVQEHVFSQIGVIDEDGIRSMWRMVLLDTQQQMPRHGIVSETASQRRETPVFCDLGSGVGNVCLQILAETTCSTAVGVEIIPSRHQAAEKAMENAKKFFPEVFEGKSALFALRDVVGCEDLLNEQKVSVLFTHSWMFDDDLMRKVSEVVKKVPTLKMVITSRPLVDGIIAGSPLTQHKVVHFSADWNDRAPFHVYMRNDS